MLALFATRTVTDLIGLFFHANLGHEFICVAQGLLERTVELAQHGHPFSFASGHVVQFLFHPGSEIGVHDIGEILGEEVGYRDAKFGRR